MSRHISDFKLPKQISDYAENHGYRVCVELTSFDAVNGYAMGIGATVQIQAYAEECQICGWHSILNPNQKRLMDENRHKLKRYYMTIFDWDDYSPRHKTLEQSFEDFVKGERNE